VGWADDAGPTIRLEMRPLSGCQCTTTRLCNEAGACVWAASIDGPGA
jgi:hypothetical protein